MLLRPAVPEDMATVADIWHRAWHVPGVRDVPGAVPDVGDGGHVLGSCGTEHGLTLGLDP